MILDLSVVVAVYNEDPTNLVRLLERLWKALSAANLSYEVIFINDGSREETAKALRQIANEVDYVKLIELSRNFGQQAAISAGLDHAEGQAAVNLDSDLQDPPELIPQMVEKWREGYDVVYVQRLTRRDKFAKRFSAFLFYRLLGSVSSIKIPWDTGEFRLIDRKVLKELSCLPEKTRFLRGMIPWLGFKQIGIAIDREARTVGESSYTLRKLIALALDGLLSFSLAPLLVIPTIGSIVLACGLIFLMASAFIHSVNGIMIGVFAALTGIQIICTGFVAVYLSKVIDEVRARPTYIVAERLGRGFTSSKCDIDAAYSSTDGAEAAQLAGAVQSFAPGAELAPLSAAPK